MKKNPLAIMDRVVVTDRIVFRKNNYLYHAVDQYEIPMQSGFFRTKSEKKYRLILALKEVSGHIFLNCKDQKEAIALATQITKRLHD